MKQFALIVIAAVACLATAFPPATSAQAVRDGKIRVLGRATVQVVPDHATVRVGISNRASSPTAALDQNSAVARKIIDFSKSFGVGEQDIQTDAINLGPAFKNVRDPNGTMRQEPDGYNALNTVHVKLKDIARLGAFMRQVLDQGATNINGVQFGVSNPEKFTDEARTKAVENAMNQAQRLAEAAKVKLGPIHEIVHPPRTEVRFADGLFDMPVRSAARTAVPVAIGVIDISAEVDITWAIE